MTLPAQLPRIPELRVPFFGGSEATGAQKIDPKDQPGPPVALDQSLRRQLPWIQKSRPPWLQVPRQLCL